jgi:hypothetical protein
MCKTIHLINIGHGARDVGRVDASLAHDGLNYEIRCPASFSFEKMPESFGLIVSAGAYVLSLAHETKAHSPARTIAGAFKEEQPSEYLRPDAAHGMAAPGRAPS